MTLTEFLLARIAEDEAVAKEASEGHHWTWDDKGEDLMSDHTYPIGSMTGRECIIATEGANPPDPSTAGAHIARHDPARVLAECEAKRRIFEAAWNLESAEFADAGAYGHVARKQREIFHALALPYADHPEFQEAWRV